MWIESKARSQTAADIGKESDLELTYLDLTAEERNALHKKHIYTTKDIIRCFPRKYHVYGDPQNIEKCMPGDYHAVSGILSYVKKSKVKFPGARWYTSCLYIRIRPISPGQMPFGITVMGKGEKLKKLIEEYGTLAGKETVICGRVKTYMSGEREGRSMDDISQIFPADEYSPYIHCIYPSIKGIEPDRFQEILGRCLVMEHDPLDPEVITKAGVITYEKAAGFIHHPVKMSDIDLGRERAVFDDLLYFLLSLKKQQVKLPGKTGKVYRSWEKAVKFIKSLPFDLTADQKNVINAIFINARKGIRNNILVQGDVGCGKTIVAVALMVYSAENGYQSVLMAPREVLAAQHFKEINGYADKLGIKCVFLHSKMKAAEKRQILAEIKSGEASFIVGTHSVISKEVKYKNLGAVIVDEEHLFGVEQKKALADKALDGAHFLSLSATPIPRTMAKVLYSDGTDIRIIRTKPAGRRPILTRRFGSRKSVMPFMLEQVRQGHQCYVVCPAIEDNGETNIVSINSIKGTYEAYFSANGYKVAIADGKMKKEESSAAVDSFVNGESQVLIATTVIEVGVNVPNATVMIIEQADRFGLASLHQLRGRVGRSSLQSYCCLLCADPENERINAICRTTDGFEIAQADMDIRGSGDLLGTEQAGANRYVEEMLDNPIIFQKASLVTEMCMEKSYGSWLVAMYREHEKICIKERLKKGRIISK